MIVCDGVFVCICICKLSWRFSRGVDVVPVLSLYFVNFYSLLSYFSEIFKIL